jgi:hypothetical protein
MNLNFLNRCLKTIRISDFMKIWLVGTELFHADGHRHDEALVGFRSCTKASKNVPVVERSEL